MIFRAFPTCTAPLFQWVGRSRIPAFAYIRHKNSVFTPNGFAAPPCPNAVGKRLKIFIYKCNNFRIAFFDFFIFTHFLYCKPSVIILSDFKGILSRKNRLTNV